MLRFERLRVWHEAVALFEAVEQATRNLHPRERSVLSDQLRRAALSVSSNIAEGSGRESLKESQHFFTVAKGSAFEVVSILAICHRQHLIAPDLYQDIYSRVENIAKMLSGLKRFGGTAAESPDRNPSRLAARGSGLAHG
jgi:four helix bundle protein